MIDMNNFFWARAMSRGFLFQFPVPWLLQCCCSFPFAFTSRLYTRALCDPSNEGRVTGGRNGWSLVLGFTLQEQINLPHGLLTVRRAYELNVPAVCIPGKTRTASSPINAS